MIKINHQIHVITRDKKIIESVKGAAVESQIQFTAVEIRRQVRDQPIGVDPSVGSSAIITVPSQIIHAVHVQFAGNNLGEQRTEVYPFFHKEIVVIVKGFIDKPGYVLGRQIRKIIF